MIDDDQQYPQNLSSDELICLPFLDTGTTSDVRAANEELNARGYTRWLVRGLRWLAGVGLWYQVFDWEWGVLGVYDVLIGYGVILLAVSFALALFGQLTLSVVGVAVALALSVVGVLGLVRRRRASDRAAA